MGNMRTLAFQVPEELFRKIKDYLQRNNLKQKEFVIGLIENEIERDLTQRAVIAESAEISKEQTEESAEQYERADESDFAAVPEEGERITEEQESSDFSDDFDGEIKESENSDENLDESEDQDESEGICITMGM